ncbi:MAG TPA: PDZ domain-containing protein [Terriglobales bacterium]|nr:PDZ domain-containing protein [Terriglobales bacterium]
MSRLRLLLTVLIGLGLGLAAAPPQLLRSPTLSATQIAFAFGGDLWIVPRNGGAATRLTAGMGVQSHPIFSPDGTQIAFTGEYDGNVDVFVVAANGGEPRRLTFHPGADRAVAWTPDGKAVLFTSNRNSYSGGFDRLFAMPLAGGLPTELPLPMGEDGSYSPDGTHIAYVPVNNWSARTAWKRYRGGRNARIWLANLADSSIEKIPQQRSNDIDPMWIGNDVYFLSDRSAAGAQDANPLALYRYDTRTRQVTKVLDPGDRDIKSASAGPGAIVYEQLGSIHLYDLKSGKSREVPITVSGDLPAMRPHFEKAAAQIQQFGISPTGVRAVFEAHGDIFTAPAKEGDIRDITRTAGVAERSPAWSPDGQSIAYFSDADGEYALHIAAQDGIGKNGSGDVRVISLGHPSSYFYSSRWSPDSKKIAFTDKRLNVWYVDTTQSAPTPVKVATDAYDLDTALDPSWSPDSEWIAFSQLLASHTHEIKVYSLADGSTHAVTDGMSDARMPVFDANGKYLYFTASTDLGPARKGIDLSGIGHQTTSSIYCLVLRRDLPSPLAPQSDEENATKPENDTRPAARPPVPTVRIDFDNVSQRILAMPIPAANYAALDAGQTGILFLREAGATPVLWRFDLKQRKREKFLDGVTGYAVSANGEKLLIRERNNWSIVDAKATPKPGEGALHLDAMEVRVDPPAEWNQMYHEVWRIERDFLYDPGAHGLNIPAAEQYYSQYLPGLASRDDLNYLFNDMLGEITIGHMFIGGGDIPAPPRVAGGLLGADYRIVDGRYQFSKVYQGENWNPTLRAPLTEPGMNVAQGEYLLAVNGREVRGTDNIYSFFEETAGRQTQLKVGPNADGTGSRTVIVEPLPTETALRNRDWMDQNRRAVDALSHGKLAYVYLPDTANGGYTNFNRYYYAQLDKQGAIMDERFNSGGDIADYIIDNLHRPQFAYFTTREGAPWSEPTGSIYGPVAMIINAFAGSGGDAMPWMFRNAKLGTLVGTRTWGGLVGIGGYPVLMDGGTVTAPREAFYNLHGDWDVENHGVAPDVDVELSPEAWRKGHDPQLERAVEVVMAQLAAHPAVAAVKPAYPNYHQRFSETPATAAPSGAKAAGGGH